MNTFTLNNHRVYVVVIDDYRTTYAEMSNVSVSTETSFNGFYSSIRGDVHGYHECNSLSELQEKYKLNNIDITDDEIITLLKEDGRFEQSDIYV